MGWMLGSCASNRKVVVIVIEGGKNSLYHLFEATHMANGLALGWSLVVLPLAES